MTIVRGGPTEAVLADDGPSPVYDCACDSFSEKGHSKISFPRPPRDCAARGYSHFSDRTV